MRNFIAYFTQFYTNETLLNFEGKKPTPTFQPFPFSLFRFIAALFHCLHSLWHSRGRKKKKIRKMMQKIVRIFFLS